MEKFKFLVLPSAPGVTSQSDILALSHSSPPAFPLPTRLLVHLVALKAISFANTPFFLLYDVPHTSSTEQDEKQEPCGFWSPELALKIKSLKGFVSVCCPFALE